MPRLQSPHDESSSSRSHVEMKKSCFSKWVSVPKWRSLLLLAVLSTPLIVEGRPALEQVTKASRSRFLNFGKSSKTEVNYLPTLDVEINHGKSNPKVYKWNERKPKLKKGNMAATLDESKEIRDLIPDASKKKGALASLWIKAGLKHPKKLQTVEKSMAADREGPIQVVRPVFSLEGSQKASINGNSARVLPQSTNYGSKESNRGDIHSSVSTNHDSKDLIRDDPEQVEFSFPVYDHGRWSEPRI